MAQKKVAQSTDGGDTSKDRLARILSGFPELN
jgi:hypothetical protein